MVDGQILGSYIMVKDITVFKKQQEEIKYLAFHDTVTKIGNRAFFHKKLKRIIKNAKTTESEFALLYLDLGSLLKQLTIHLDIRQGITY